MSHPGGRTNRGRRPVQDAGLLHVRGPSGPHHTRLIEGVAEAHPATGRALVAATRHCSGKTESPGRSRGSVVPPVVMRRASALHRGPLGPEPGSRDGTVEEFWVLTPVRAPCGERTVPPAHRQTPGFRLRSATAPARFPVFHSILGAGAGASPLLVDDPRRNGRTQVGHRRVAGAVVTARLVRCPMVRLRFLLPALYR